MKPLTIYEARDKIAQSLQYNDWKDLKFHFREISESIHDQAAELLLKSINQAHIAELESVNQGRIKREIELHKEVDLFIQLYYKETKYLAELKNSYQLLEALILDYRQYISDALVRRDYDEHFGLTTKRLGEIEL